LPTDASQTNWNTAFNKRLSSASFSSSTLTLTLADASTVTASVPTFNQNTTGTAGSLSAVLSKTLGGAGDVTGILKANGTGTVSAAVAGDITSLISGTYLPLSGGTLTGALNGTSAAFSGAGSFGNTISSTDGTIQTILSYGTGIGSVGTNTNHPLILLANASEMARLVPSTGAFSVGGVGSPQGTLHVGNANSAVIINESSSIAQVVGTNRTGNTSAGLFLKGFPLTFTGNGGGSAEQMRLTSSGRLLINTTTESPNNEALQVAGSGLFTGKINNSSDNDKGLQFGTISRIRQQTANTRIEFITADAADFYDIAAKAATFSSTVTTPFLSISATANALGNINTTNATGGYITWQTNGTTIADLGTATQIFGSGGSEVFGINARGARSLAFGTNNTSRFTIASDGAITASSSVTANSFVTTGSVRTTNPSDASYFGLFSNDGAMVFDAYGVGAFSSFKVNGTSVLSVDASGAVINGTSRANGYRFAYSTKSSNYTLTDNDDYVVVTNTSTVTLPTAVGRAGKRYVIRSTAGSGVSSSLTTTSSQTIDGILPFPSPFSFGFGNYNIIIVFSDGSNWFSETFITGG